MVVTGSCIFFACISPLLHLHRSHLASFASSFRLDSLCFALSRVHLLLYAVHDGTRAFPPLLRASPRGPAHSARPPQKSRRAHKSGLFRDQKIDHFLDSILDRVWLVGDAILGYLFFLLASKWGPSLIKMGGVECLSSSTT